MKEFKNSLKKERKKDRKLRAKSSFNSCLITLQAQIFMLQFDRPTN